MGVSTAAAAHALHERLLRDRRIQFRFDTLELPQPHLPKWLLDSLAWIGGGWAVAFTVFIVILVLGLAAGLLTVIFLILREVFGTRLPAWLPRGRARSRAAPTDFAPDPIKALALLEDADRLAAADRFDEAARLILRRSVEDIEARRPSLVRPALTAREIAGLAEVPAAARAAFAAMTAIVERSVFAGRRLGRADFLDCRATYERFAFPEAWA